MKKLLYTFLFILAGITNSFAVNIADSDISNTAGSNSGHMNISPFILVVLFLLLAAAAPFYSKNTNTTEKK